MARKKNFNKTIFEDKIKDQLNMSLRRDIAMLGFLYKYNLSNAHPDVL